MNDEEMERHGSLFDKEEIFKMMARSGALGFCVLFWAVIALMMQRLF